MDSDVDKNITNYMGSFSGLMSGSILMLAVGWFIYGGFNGAFGLVIFSSLTIMSILFALIPFGIGIIIQTTFIFMWIIPTIYNLSGIYDTWITWLIICGSLLIGIIFNIIATVKVLTIKL